MKHRKLTLLCVFVQCLLKLSLGTSLSCLPTPSPDDACIQIHSWSDFENHISSMNSIPPLVLCPFFIQKISKSALRIKNHIKIICLAPGQCSVDASASGGNSILKLDASHTSSSVLMQGINFLNSGSAIHVLSGVSSHTLLCECEFKSNKGMIRGTAVLNELGNTMRLIGCTFAENYSNSMGGVYNRGTMNVENCVFRNNTGIGGAIGTSSTSNTALKNNRFEGNRNNEAIFFHRPNFEDLGGNKALNNDGCNGIFVLKGKQCLSFRPPTEKEPSSTHEHPALYPHLEPRPTPSGSTSCEKIADFNEFRRLVERSSSNTIIFCPFDIEKGANDTVRIEYGVNILCQETYRCRINGPNKHMMVVGPSARIFLQGFTFQGATDVAVHIVSSARKPQIIRNCHFIENQGHNRGVGLRAEHNTIVKIISCLFEKNKSTNIGGAIFNRGSMLLISNTFISNHGTGAVLGCGPGLASIEMKDNQFIGNSGDLAEIFFQGISWQADLGGNNASDNAVCNGMYDSRGERRCITFAKVTPGKNPSLKPSSTHPATSTPHAFYQDGEGYFNYDPYSEYGPDNNWGRIRNNAEHLRYKELSGTQQRDLTNKCNRNNFQSPIDLCEDKINAECHEHHQTRTHRGNVKFGEQITAQILPSKLRLKYYPDRPPTNGPYPPEADFAYNWHGYAEVNHIDVKIPSEHTICGRQYPVEYAISVLHPERRQMIVMSILMDFNETSEDNDHFQKAIDEWQKAYDERSTTCANRRNMISKNSVGLASNRHTSTQDSFNIDVSTTEEAVNIVSSIFVEETKQNIVNTNLSSVEIRDNDIFSQFIHNQYPEKDKSPLNPSWRDLVDNTPYGNSGWDPFHPSLETSIYHWGYWGSLTEPPCSDFVAWRVLTEPAYISQRQWKQMKRILFTYQGEDCNFTSVNYKDSVARPTQNIGERSIYKCRRSDYVGDKEKGKIRRET